MSSEPELPAPRPQPRPDIDYLRIAKLLGASKSYSRFEVEPSSASNKLADTTAELEQRLQEQSDSRNEERFYWIVLAAVLAAPMLYKGVDGSKVAFSIIELIVVAALIGLAKSLGVEHVAVFLERIFHRLNLNFSKPNPSASNRPTPEKSDEPAQHS